MPNNLQGQLTILQGQYIANHQFDIGDYHSHTLHLSEIEDLTYRRLLDWYYLHESPAAVMVGSTPACSETSRATTQERYNSYSTALNNGFLNVNEVRALEDRAPVDGGNEYWKPLNIWISSERSWLPPGLFDSLKVDEIPAAGVLAVDSSIDESLYCGVRAQRVGDDRIGVTVEFLADSLAQCWRSIGEAATSCDAIALTPSLFDIAPPELERKKPAQKTRSC